MGGGNPKPKIMLHKSEMNACSNIVIFLILDIQSSVDWDGRPEKRAVTSCKAKKFDFGR